MNRIATYRRTSKALGIEIKGMLLTQVVEHSDVLEAKIIKYMAKNCKRNTTEYFICDDLTIPQKAFTSTGVVFFPALDIRTQKIDGTLRFCAVLQDSFVDDVYMTQKSSTGVTPKSDRERILRLLKKHNKPITTGVLRNKIRSISHEAIDVAMDFLEKEGYVTHEVVFNKYNRVTTKRYTLAD